MSNSTRAGWLTKLSRGGRTRAFMNSVRLLLIFSMVLWNMGPTIAVAADELTPGTPPAAEQPVATDTAATTTPTITALAAEQPPAETPQTPFASAQAEPTTTLTEAIVYTPSIQTDKPSYQAGQSVVITGSGFKPGEQVSVVITKSSGEAAQDRTVSADGGGAIYETYLVPADGTASYRYGITATGLESGGVATASFTDPGAVFISSPRVTQESGGNPGPEKLKPEESIIGIDVWSPTLIAGGIITLHRSDGTDGQNFTIDGNVQQALPAPVFINDPEGGKYHYYVYWSIIKYGAPPPTATELFRVDVVDEFSSHIYGPGPNETDWYTLQIDNRASLSQSALDFLDSWPDAISLPVGSTFKVRALYRESSANAMTQLAAQSFYNGAVLELENITQYWFDNPGAVPVITGPTVTGAVAPTVFDNHPWFSEAEVTSLLPTYDGNDYWVAEYEFKVTSVGAFTITPYVQTMRGGSWKLDSGYTSSGAVPGTISGKKFLDVDGDGVKDPEDTTGLAGWKIYLDMDNNGAFNTGDIETTTVADNPATTTVNEAGNYYFSNVMPNIDGTARTYKIREILDDHPGWAQTYPASPGTQTVSMTPGANITTGTDFGNYELPKVGSISGLKWDDKNGNGTRDNYDTNGDGTPDTLEPILGNWTIYIDTNSSGAFEEASDKHGHTDPTTGLYTIDGLTAGDYTVKEVLQSGWTPTSPATGSQTAGVIAGANTPGVNFGNFKNVSISGMKFNDLNGDGSKTGDPGLNGWEIHIKKGGVDIAGSPFTTSGGGLYSATNLGPGTYVISETNQAGWTQTAPAGTTYTVNAASGTNVTDRDFGNQGRGSISGFKFVDIDGNGVKDGADYNYLGGWDITVTGPVTQTQTTSLVDGTYSFTNLPAGNYTVSEAANSAWTQTVPTAPATHSVTLGAGTDATNKFFGNFQNITISGMKFNDLNGDGSKTGDPGLNGWEIHIKKGGVDIAGSPFTTSGGGLYSATNLGPGTYVISETNQAGWTQTAPAGTTYTVNAASGTNVTDRDFGNFENFTKTFALTVNEPILGATYYVDYVSTAGNGTLTLVRDGSTNTYKADTTAFTGPVTISSWTWRITNSYGTIWSKTIPFAETLTAHKDNTYTMSYELVLTPPTALNQVEEAHDFTATVTADDGQVLTNLPVYYSVTSPATATPTPPQTTNGSGQITFSVNSTTPTLATVSSWVNETDGTSVAFDEGEANDTSTKRWIDYELTVNPPIDNNIVGVDHVFTVTLTKDMGDGAGYVPAGGETVTLNLIGTTGYIQDVGGVVYGPPTVMATGATDAVTGTLTVTIRAASAGISLLIASSQYAVDSGTMTATGNPGVKTWEYGSISGYIRMDTNTNGAFDAGEPGLNSWRAFLDINGNGYFDPGIDPFDMTDANGFYEIGNLAAGTYEVYQELQGVWAQTYPVAPVYYTAVLTDADRNSTGNDFGNTMADMAIVKTDTGYDPLQSGQEIVYTNVITNNGPCLAEDVVFTDTPPAELTAPIEYRIGAGAWTAWTGSADLGDMAAGASETVYFRGTVIAAPGTITNTASVSSETPDPNLTNNTDNEDTLVVKYILVVGPPEAVNRVGQEHEFYVHLTKDDGTSVTDVAGAQVQVSLDSTTGYLTGWGYDGATHVKTGTYAPGTTMSDTLTTDAFGYIYVYAVSMDPGTAEFSANYDYNLAGASLTVISDPDAEKEWTPGTISGHIRQDTNTDGTYDAGEPGLENWRAFIDQNDNGTYDAGEPTDLADASGYYEIGNLSAGTYEVYEVLEGVWEQTYPTAPEYFTATVSGSTPDVTGLDFGNARADLTIQKTDVFHFGSAPYNYNEVQAGQKAVYELTVSNLGECTALNVSVTDTAPAVLTNLEFNLGDPSIEAGWQPWATLAPVPSLAAGGQYTFYVRGTVAPTAPLGVFTNRVDVTSDTPDPNLGNNFDLEDTTVVEYTITVGPAEAVNRVGQEHEFTIYLTKKNGTTTAGVAGASVNVALDAASTAGYLTGWGQDGAAKLVSYLPGTTTSATVTTNPSGYAYVYATSPTPGMAILYADYNYTLGHADLSITTDPDAYKNWINYQLTIEPALATNPVNEPHDFLVKLIVDDGVNDNAADGLSGTWDPAAGEIVNIAYTLHGSVFAIDDADGYRIAPPLNSGKTEADGTFIVWAQSGGTAGTGKLTATYNTTIGGALATFNSNEAIKIWQAGTINGFKWADIDADGTWDTSEPGLSGWTIKLEPIDLFDIPGPSQIQGVAYTATTITGTGGAYTFANVPPGTYKVFEEIHHPSQDGWAQTYPTDPNYHVVTVLPDQTVANVNFGNHAIGEIIGTVWYDINANQIIDQGEQRLSGWTVTLYASDGLTVLATQLSGPDGGYLFDNLLPGTYYVSETINSPEWSNTTPIKRKVVLTYINGDIITQIADFGNDKPFLPFTPKEPLPYTGGLYHARIANAASAHDAQKPSNPPLHGSADGLLLAALAVLLIGLAVPVTRRFARTAGN
ncbi:MAG: SdrD B-like domain-containing protein [Actinomycetota bacterium]